MLEYDIMTRLKHSNLIKVFNFGQAETGRIKGTIQYIAPEVINNLEADQRLDIFSLGVLLYEMINGTHLYGDSSVDVIINSMNNELKYLGWHHL